MPEPPINVHQLELFCAVVERGSFARAGAELFITPSALSIQVKRLERDLGVSLLRRVPGGMAPTDAGRELYAVGRAMLDLRRAASRRMADLRQGTVGTISIGVIHTAPLYFLAEVLRDFCPAFPQVTVTVEMGEREELLDAMVRGSVDLGLDWGPISRAGVVAERLLDERWAIIASARHPLAALEVVSREQFAATPFLGMQFSARSPGFSEAVMAEAGLRPNVVMRLASTDDVRRLVEIGLGIGSMGLISAERDIAAGRLVALTVEGFSYHQPLYLFRPAGRPRSPSIARFCRFLREHPRIRGAASEMREAGGVPLRAAEVGA
jgi:LysR family transcriptional regulator, low CO2-responsive transcriptional regulator